VPRGNQCYFFKPYFGIQPQRGFAILSFQSRAPNSLRRLRKESEFASPTYQPPPWRGPMTHEQITALLNASAKIEARMLRPDPANARVPPTIMVAGKIAGVPWRNDSYDADVQGSWPRRYQIGFRFEFDLQRVDCFLGDEPLDFLPLRLQRPIFAPRQCHRQVGAAATEAILGSFQTAPHSTAGPVEATS